MAKTKAQKAQDARDARIERLYGLRCSGVTINIMDIPKIFRFANGAISANPEITDAELGDVIAAHVNTIKVAA